MFVVSASVVFFFFKQKTADEMRISDWSSDVCSSDIIRHALAGRWRQLRAFQRQQIALVRDAAGKACQVAIAADHAMAGCDDRERIAAVGSADRSEEHTSELQSLMRISYAVFCLKKKNIKYHILSDTTTMHHT